jgi:DNA-binding response OmpR family regulator
VTETALVLIVEDDGAIAEVVEFSLRRAGFATRTARTLAEARRVLAAEPVDLTVLDLGLPDGDGLELCRTDFGNLTRGRRPVLILSSRDEEMDRVLGLEIGADDYMVKPFSARELVARVRGILRRSHSLHPLHRITIPAAAPALRLGRVSLDAASHRVRLDQEDLPLTPTEFGLLRILLTAPQRVFTRDHLIAQVYDDNTFVSDRTIDSHVKGVRRKFARVDTTADPIETLFGVGYRARALIVESP